MDITSGGYPELKGEFSIRDARIIAPLYAGRESETTAIMQYIYNHYITEGEVSKVMMTISLQEMKHHELLGEAIVKSGGNPVIGDYLGWWSGRYLTYVSDIDRMIRNAIRSEEDAAAAYYRAVARVSNVSLKELLRCIARDEEIHAVMLNNLLNNR